MVDTTFSNIRQLAFPVEEYQARLAQVQASMSARGQDALLLHRRASLCYLTGMENCYMTAPYYTVVPARGEPVLIASQFEMLNAEATSWCAQRVTFRVGDDPLKCAAGVVADHVQSDGVCGVELGALSARQLQGLQGLLPGLSLREADDVVPLSMQRKSPLEVEKMRRAGELSALGMEAALAECAEGKSDNDAAAAAYDAMVRAGGEFMCIEPIVTVGPRSGIPHSTFRRTRLEKGDAVFVEVGGCFHRYSAPLMRTAVIGAPADDVREAGEACVRSLSAVIEAMRPGVPAREAALCGKAAWEEISTRLIWHGIYGYSVGLGFPPDWNDTSLLITENSDYVLESGMCFHVTTSLRDALQFGTAFSETVLVTDNGPEVLTGTARELRVV